MSSFVNAMGVLILTVAEIGFLWGDITLDYEHEFNQANIKFLFLIFMWVGLAVIVYSTYLWGDLNVNIDRR